MTDIDTTTREAQEALARLDKAAEEIGEVAANVRSRWRMSIPANPNRDTDLIVSDACVAGQRAITALLAVIEQQQATIDRQDETLRQVREALQSLADTLVFSARDWGTGRDLAWLWGILQGWDDDDPECDAMPEQVALQGWDQHEVARLRGFHATIRRIIDAGNRSKRGQR